MLIPLIDASKLNNETILIPESLFIFVSIGTALPVQVNSYRFLGTGKALSSRQAVRISIYAQHKP